MAIIEFIKSLFARDKIAWDGLPEEREICMRYSRGNVNLQLGRIISAADYEMMKANTIAYKFS